MASRLLRFRSYLVLFFVSLYLLAATVLPTAPDRELGAAALFAIGCLFSGTRLRVNRFRGVLAPSDLFVVGVVAAADPLPAAALSAAAVAIRWSCERRVRQQPVHYAVRVLFGAMAGLWTSLIYRSIVLGLGGEWIALGGAAIFYLLVSSWAESTVSRLTYWRRLAGRNLPPAAGMSLLFAPAAVCLAVVSARSQDVMLWTSLAAVTLFYVFVEWLLGPLYEDLSQQAETDRIYFRSVEALALAVDAKDSVSSGHLKRVQIYSTEIGKALNCSEYEIRTLEFGALLHDIGKIAVPENVLTKPGRLSPEEFSRVASHAQIGAEILAAVDFPFPVAELVLCHHENWDGTGYPRKLRGEEIPLTARILTVVDAFDELTTDRPYRPAMTVEKAIEMIRARRGTAYDPRVTDTLIELLPRMEKQIRRNPSTNRRNPSSRFSIKSPRSFTADQTSLTHEERIESLKQGREVARRELEPDSFAHWSRLLSSLGSSFSVKEILEFVIPTLEGRLSFDECVVFMKGERELRPVYCTGPKADLISKLTVPVDNSPTGWVAGHGQTLVNGNPVAETSELGLMTWMQGLKAALVTPLWSEGELVGTFNLYSNTQAAYSGENAALIEKLTQPLGSLLEQAALYQTSGIGTDSLTGLPTAAATLKYLRSEIELAHEEGRTTSIVYFDIDRFQVINARFGHAAGDQLLESLARILESSLRDLDFLGRLGDDRFLAVLGGIGPKGLRTSMARLDKRLKDSLTLRMSDAERLIGVSIGTAVFPSEGTSAEQLLVLSSQRSYLRKLKKAAASADIPQSSPAPVIPIRAG